ncbi:phenylalanine--tRNA ligase subunit beta [Hydrogenothermus marinus]|uniref:Phenylalanine--tRNA ligase beta subunit n=1 Tax=Hydrogenothermus marinus TaxID=133270 RepID=A0A3M0BE05_9AQUI|nr:phenylalanine--tRNA ligase subunit beta [Hydrogenothermus marinus]RMA93198.1 phenylalanyl-tRNA synthetase beta subunit [Hydrogenothermus marinus]
MRVSYNWIKELVDIDETPEKIEEKLNETGLETTVEKFGNYIPNLTTVKIISITPHPEKNNLLVCKATDSEKEYQVITTAKNIKENDIVILAKEGAKIKGKEIKPTNFGSITSEGMFLSLTELDIGIETDELFILGEDTPIGVDASKLLGLGEDYIFEIEITPNRGDALSVKGLAREIAAVFGVKRKEIIPIVSIFKEKEPQIQINTDKVYRYRGIILENVSIKPSPVDIQIKLIKSGQKPINNIVDFTNYVLLLEGQPFHAFDLDKIKGKVIVRQAKEGEKIVALDGNEYSLKETDIVIADEEKTIAIAGVIGGDNTKVDENTKNILLEAANFDPISVRKTAKRLAINTDSSYRFERGVDIENLPKAQDIAVELIEKYANGKAVGEKDLYLKPYTSKVVRLREKQIKRILGIDIPLEEAVEILNRLEIPSKIEGDEIIAEIPAFRAYDLEREIDLIEEVGRVKGFNNLEESYPSVSTKQFETPEYYKFEEGTRQFFLSNGLNEVLTYSFSGEEEYETVGIEKPTIEIINYILKSQRLMRNTLIVSLLNVQKENLRYGNKDLSIFEIATTFFDDREETRLGILLSGKFIDGYNYTQEDKKFSTTKKWDFLKVKGLLTSYLTKIGLKDTKLNIEDKPFLNKYESAKLIYQDIEIGYFGKIHPKAAEKLEIPDNTYVGELYIKGISRDLNGKLNKKFIFDLFKEKPTITYQDIPKYPSVKRDLAFEADENFEVGKLLEEIEKTCKFVKKVKLFDVYYIGNGKKSIAVSIEFNAGDRSLTDEEVNKIVEDLVKDLSLKLKVNLRS